jgi:putative ABC transport system permease protein
MTFSPLVSAGRGLRRDPRFTVGFAIVLGLGVAGVLFVIGVLSATVYRAIPWIAPEQLYSIHFRDNSIPRQWTVREASAARAAGLPGVAVTWYSRFELDVAVENDSAPMRVAVIEPHLFEVLGLTAREGVVTGAAEASDEGVVFISSGARNRLFAGSAAVGKQVRLGNRFYVVMGVLPGGVEFPLGTDLWRVEAPLEARAGERAVDVIVRDSAGRPSQTLAEQLTHVVSDSRGRVEPGVRTTVVATSLLEYARPQIGRRTRVILTGVGAVVVLIVITLANTLLLRAQRARFSSAVRLTLGAPFSALVRHTIAEIALLVGASFVTGALIAYALAGVFSRLLRDSLAHASVTVSGAWLLPLLLALIAIAGLLAVASVLPLRRVSPAVSLRSAMPSGTPSTSRLRRVFLGLQVSASVLFLLLAAAIGATYVEVSRLDVGFDFEDVGFATVGLRGEQFADPARTRAVAAEMASRARVALGASAVAVWGTTYPHRHAAQTESPIQIPERELPAQDPSILPVLSLDVNAEVFGVLGVPLRQGRLFDSTDVLGNAPVVILDALAARALYGDQSAIGRKLRLGGRESDLPWMTVVGVVASSQPIHPYALEWQLTRTRYPLMYRPLAQAAPSALLAPLSDPGFSIAVSTNGAAQRAPSVFARLASELIPEERVAFNGALSSFIDRAGRIDESKFEAVALGIFGVLGIILALAGVATAIDETLHARTREIGIRVALGAPARAIMRLVCVGTLGPTMVGALVGVLTFAVGGRAVGTLLRDSGGSGGGALGAIQWSFVLAASLGTAIAMAAVVLWRSRRAAVVDPATALRVE